MPFNKLLTKTLLYDKAIYNIAVDLDTNIEGLDNFSGYNYSWRIGIDPDEKLFEYVPPWPE